VPDSKQIKFSASDVMPRAQKDGSFNIVFECGEDSKQAAALLCLLRKIPLVITVEELA
jgi:hypothetical protein